mmetsp:Transcript_32656/g.68726  ORF Transcript_32656/g.68726 Transcript_32656/m.68726 type:complete len:333 (-) Transcript_32656:358-1356(-)
MHMVHYPPSTGGGAKFGVGGISEQARKPFRRAYPRRFISPVPAAAMPFSASTPTAEAIRAIIIVITVYPPIRPPRSTAPIMPPVTDGTSPRRSRRLARARLHAWPRARAIAIAEAAAAAPRPRLVPMRRAAVREAFRPPSHAPVRSQRPPRPQPRLSARHHLPQDPVGAAASDQHAAQPSASLQARRRALALARSLHGPLPCANATTAMKKMMMMMMPTMTAMMLVMMMMAAMALLLRRGLQPSPTLMLRSQLRWLQQRQLLVALARAMFLASASSKETVMYLPMVVVVMVLMRLVWILVMDLLVVVLVMLLLIKMAMTGVMAVLCLRILRR